MTGSQLLSNSVKSRSARQRIASFRQRFGDGHFYLACHAAMPIALTPDLLYSLWANFQRDTHGDAIEIPWIAVADFMLSSLCEEVGQELYEIDQEVQDELLNQLQQDSRLGLERIRELADFVMAYIEQQLDSPDLDVRDLAQGQQWKALAYKNPSEAAHSIATVLAQLPLSDKSEWIRMDTLIGSLAEPLSAYQPLLNYIRAMASLARGNLDAAIAQMARAVDANNQVRVEGIDLPIPDIINEKPPKPTEDVPLVVPPINFKLVIKIAGSIIVTLLILIELPNDLQLPKSQQISNIDSSVSPSPRTTSPASPGIQRSPSTSPSPSASNPSPLTTLAPSPLQKSPIPSISVSPTSVPTTVPGSVSPSAAPPQKTSSPTPSASVSPSPDSQNVPPRAEEAVLKQAKLQQALAKIRASRPREPLTVSPNNQYIASGGQDGILRLWRSDGRLLRSFAGHKGTIYSVSFSPDGKMIATGSADNTVKLWSLEGQELMTLEGHSEAVNSVSFSPDVKRILTADGTTSWLYDLTGKRLAEFPGSSPSFSPDAKQVVTGDGSTSRLYDLSGKKLAEFQGSDPSFSPNAKQILTTNGTTSWLYNLSSKRLAEFPGSSPSFSPDGSIITTVGANNFFRYWDRSGNLLAPKAL